MTPLAVLLLPAAVFALLPHMSRAHGLRAAFVRSVLVTALILALMTEVLSLVHLVRPVAVGFVWLLVIAGSSYLATLDHGQGSPLRLTWDFARERLARGGRQMVRTPSTIVLSLGVLTVLGIILVIALASPPNNWDSMSYHLPRVMHWASQHNVSFYPTSIDRQLYSAPLAEYVILHVYLLTGSDWFFNCVQWAALGGCAVVASLIARQLGGERRAQALAAFIAVTVPMAILEASSTQNDLVEAFFLLVLAYAALQFRDSAGGLLSASWPLAAALALALLAKSTGYLIAAPFVVLGLSVRWRTPRLLVVPLALILGFVVVVNLGQSVRNEKAYGSLVGPPSSHVLVNSHFSPAVTAVSSLRLLGSAGTSTHASMNNHLLSIVHHGSDLVGAKTDDPGTLYGAGAYSVGWSQAEDTASYPVTTLAICLLLLLTLLRVPPLRGVRAGYAAAGVVAFLVFASYLRWQPWINRLDMPLAMLWTPLIAVAIVAWHRFLVIPAALVFGWLAPTFLLHNATRPLGGHPNVLSIPSLNLMFWNRGVDLAPYLVAQNDFRFHHAKIVGVIEGADDWEYPLWHMNGGALHGIKFVDIRASDLKGKKPPHYDVAVCTDPVLVSCNALVQPGWDVTPLGNNMAFAAPAG